MRIIKTYEELNLSKINPLSSENRWRKKILDILKQYFNRPEVSDVKDISEELNYKRNNVHYIFNYKNKTDWIKEIKLHIKIYRKDFEVKLNTTIYPKDISKLTKIKKYYTSYRFDNHYYSFDKDFISTNLGSEISSFVNFTVKNLQDFIDSQVSTNIDLIPKLIDEAYKNALSEDKKNSNKESFVETVDELSDLLVNLEDMSKGEDRYTKTTNKDAGSVTFTYKIPGIKIKSITSMFSQENINRAELFLTDELIKVMSELKTFKSRLNDNEIQTLITFKNNEVNIKLTKL